MERLYVGIVRKQAPRLVEFFKHVQHARAPLVFHCTAGKDRTGFAAALILLSLGVQREAVMQDYLLTNALLKMPPFL